MIITFIWQYYKVLNYRDLLDRVKLIMQKININHIALVIRR